MSFELDRESLLVHVPGSATLAAIEGRLAPEGLTLGLARVDDEPVGRWLARGAPGAPSALSDPADHLVAGLTATLTNGAVLEVRPSPRRAVGPDLVALCIGANDRFASVDHVWLRAHRKEAARVALPIDRLALDAPMTDGEARLLDAIARELAR